MRLPKRTEIVPSTGPVFAVSFGLHFAYRIQRFSDAKVTFRMAAYCQDGPSSMRKLQGLCGTALAYCIARTFIDKDPQMQWVWKLFASIFGSVLLLSYLYSWWNASRVQDPEASPQRRTSGFLFDETSAPNDAEPTARFRPVADRVPSSQSEIIPDALPSHSTFETDRGEHRTNKWRTEHWWIAIPLVAGAIIMGGISLSESRKSADVLPGSTRPPESDRQIADLQQEVAELNAKLTEVTSQNAELAGRANTNTLDQQRKCAQQAHQDFEEWGWKDKESSDFVSHYNPTLDRCFIQTQNTDGNGEFFWRHLFDAYGGQDYGEYAWQQQSGKKYWEVRPFVCHVTLPSGEKRYCNSDDEFQDLAKVYMGN